MTIASQDNKVRALGNNIVVAFPFTFPILDESELEVSKIDTSVDPEVAMLQIIAADYHVTINADSEGGTVTYNVAPTSDEDSFIKRVNSLDQLTDIPRESNFPEESMENALDKLTKIVIQLSETLDRAVLLPEFSASSGPTLPEPDEGKGLLWDAGGNFVNTSEDLEDLIAAAAASAAAAAASAAAAAVSAAASAASAAAANISASTASTKAIEAAASAAAAVASAAAALASEAAALASQIAAAASAVTAANEATAALNSAAAALTSANNAQTAQTNAETAETNAQTAETNAQTAETNAETAETNAAASAVSAAISAAAALATRGALEPTAQSTPNDTVAVASSIIDSFYQQIWKGRLIVSFAGGNSPAIAAPAGNPRIDILYLTNGEALAVITGDEGGAPSPKWADLPSDSIPIALIWTKTTMSVVVDFVDRAANPNEGYIYRDIRPFMAIPTVTLP